MATLPSAKRCAAIIMTAAPVRFIMEPREC
jgi:hypothetical protein